VSIFLAGKRFSATSGGNITANVSTASGVFLQRDPNRLGFTIRNNSRSNLYLAMGETATTEAAIKIDPGAIYECPIVYSGVVSGVWDASDSDGYALITEAFRGVRVVINN
jgi:hypothetical protein